MLAALAVYGVVLTRRRGVPVLPLLAPPVLVTVVSALVGLYALPGRRGDSVVVLAAVAADQLAAGMAERRAGRAGSPAAA